MNEKERENNVTGFELIPVRQDLVSLQKEYKETYMVYEKKTFALLGQDFSTQTKENALRGKKMIKEKLDELMNKRKSVTNVFRDITAVFTSEEKLHLDLIDRLQTYANECLKVEKKNIDEANAIIAQAREKTMADLDSADIPTEEKVIAKVEALFAESVELLDDTTSRKVCELKFLDKIGLGSLFNWYYTSQVFQEMPLNDYQSITVGKMITQARREYMKSTFALRGIEFTISEAAK